jgi:outer membrane receptor protein involved in Fe transport
MNAAQLDQIEIMTNPPAKYDAAGNSGIINIKTKKNKAKGFNGSATAGFSQGSYWRSNGNLNLNYRNGRYNAFFNYSYNKNNSFQELTIHRTYRKDDLKTVDAMFDQVAFMPSTNTGNNLKLGMDYFLLKKQQLDCCFRIHEPGKVPQFQYSLPERWKWRSGFHCVFNCTHERYLEEWQPQFEPSSSI